MRAAVVLLALAACGKIGFDDLPRGDGSVATDDGPVCPMDPVPTAATIAATVTGPSRFSGSCGGDMSPELRVPFDMPAGATVVLAADLTAADTQVYIATSCDPAGNEVACDASDGVGDAGAIVAALPAGRYWAFVDGGLPNTSLSVGADLVVELPAGAACTGVPPYWRCGPNLACGGAGACTQTCAIPSATFQGGSTYTINGTTSGASLHAGSCGEGGDGGRRAPEDVFVLRLPMAVSSVDASTDDAMSNFDTLIYMRSGCAGAEIACNDDVAAGSVFSSHFVTGPLPAGDYYVFVDGFGHGEGNYRLAITVTP